MKLKTSAAICLSIIIFFFFGFQCQKESPFPIPTNQFVEKVTLFPYKKTYQIGDTLWLQFQTASKSLYERVTNQVIPSDTTFLALTFQYQKRFPIQFNAVADTFCYTMTSFGLNQGLKVLREFQSCNYLTYLTDCSQNFYYFKVGFIPKTTGIYSLNWPAGDLIDCPTKITKSSYSIISFRFDLADCNKAVYLSIPPASRGESVKGQTERETDEKKYFFFKVE